MNTMTKKGRSDNAKYARANSSLPADTEIRPVSILPNRKTPVGWVAHHFPCQFSTAIMCDEVKFNPKEPIETGYEAAKRLLNLHLRDCPLHLPLSYGTRPEESSS